MAAETSPLVTTANGTAAGGLSGLAFPDIDNDKVKS